MSRRATAIASGTVAVALASLFACRQIADFREEPAAARTGTDAGTDAAAASAACGFGYGTSRCASCVSAHCCPESSACATNPGCAPYASCVAGCAGEPACRAQCSLDFPPSDSDAGPVLSACLVAKCETECGLTCGSLVIRPERPDAAAACQSCIVANGCDVARACGASVDCNALRFCTHGCSSVDCSQACGNAQDAGGVLTLALTSVTQGKCLNACPALGADWSCVGHVTWLRPKSDTVTMTIEVTDFTNTMATFSEVDVKVCDRKDLECTNAMAHGTTNDKGRVVLQFPNPLTTGNLGLNGYVQLQSSPDAGADTKIIPTLYYWGFPLSEAQYELATAPGWRLSIEVVTLAELTRLGNAVGIPYDPSHGDVVATAQDCSNFLASGVQITTDPSYPNTSEIYGLDPTNKATDSTAIATFSGLPEGSLDVIATPNATGKPSSRQQVYVRPGWITAPMMFPTP